MLARRVSQCLRVHCTSCARDLKRHSSHAASRLRASPGALGHPSDEGLTSGGIHEENVQLEVDLTPSSVPPPLSTKGKGKAVDKQPRNRAKKLSAEAHASSGKAKVKKPKKQTSKRLPDTLPDGVDVLPPRGSKESDLEERPLKKILVPPGPNRLESYLLALEASGSLPTLDDLAKFRPRGFEFLSKKNYKGYKQLYANTVSSLGRSFTLPQLTAFAKDLGIIGQHSRPTKAPVIEAIVGKYWRMPHPVDVEKRHLEQNLIQEQAFPLSIVELFLLLGKDGTNFLTMSAQFSLRIFVDSDPLAIRARGVKTQLENFTHYLSEEKKKHISETLSLGIAHKIRSDILQSISQLSGAFVENLDGGQVRITGDDQAKVTFAARLSRRAASNEIIAAASPTLAHLANDDQHERIVPFAPTYGLYPFNPANELPWTFGGRDGFRARRVGEWLMGAKVGELRSLNGGGTLASTHSTLPLDLRSALLEALPEPGTDSTRRVIASSGHVLFLSNGPSSQRATLVPPLPGAWPFSAAFDWVNAGKGRPAFLPSLPAPLLQKRRQTETIFHRLTYRHVPRDLSLGPDSTAPLTKIIQCEMTMPAPTAAPPPPTNEIGDWKPSQQASNKESDELEPATSPQPSSFTLSVQCGVERQLDLVLPDRPMDLQLKIMDTHLLDADHRPDPLRSFFSSLVSYLTDVEAPDAQPDPPTAIIHQGITYELDSNFSVRQNPETLPPLQADEHGVIWPDFEVIQSQQDQGDVPAISERLLDLESAEQTAVSQVICADVEDEDSWRQFLDACDRLTLHVYPRIPASERAPSLAAP